MTLLGVEKRRAKVPCARRAHATPLRTRVATIRPRTNGPLVDAGFMRAYAMRGTLYWRVGSKTGTMMLEDWFVLIPIEDKDKIVAMLSWFV